MAAYFDGEFEGRDDTAALRRQVEAWLARCPEARAQLTDYRRLRKAWQHTSPTEPRQDHWDHVLAGLAQEVGRPRSAAPRRRPWILAAGAAAVAASLALAWLAWPNPHPVDNPENQLVLNQPDDDDLPWIVARADEIVILAVEGADTGTLVVGEPPLKGSLELATKDEIRVTDMQPDQRDNMVPRVRGDRPMIWAFLDSER